MNEKLKDFIEKNNINLNKGMGKNALSNTGKNQNSRKMIEIKLHKK